MNLWFTSCNCLNCGCRVVQISHEVSDNFFSTQRCVWESPILGCTTKAEDIQCSLQLKSQICLDMRFRFLVSNQKNEDNVSLVFIDETVNTELFLHSSELDEKIWSSVRIMLGTCSVLASSLSQQWAAREGNQCPGWYNSLEALTRTWWESNHGLWLTFTKWPH